VGFAPNFRSVADIFALILLSDMRFVKSIYGGKISGDFRVLMKATEKSTNQPT
jgi:hypothetical protein